MQLKTIRKNIETKLESWLSTITDESLRKELKDNILVSGGSITSMLLNEPVNDYDVYIHDRAVLLRLVKYYINDIPDVKILDGENKATLVDELEKDYKFSTDVEDIDSINSAYAVSLRNLKDDQIKLYFTEKGGGKKWNEDIPEDKLNFHVQFLSPNAISLSNNLQIVIRFFGDAEAIHKTFDFIHATNYFTFKEGVVTNVAALESLLTKQLKYQGSMYPLTSVIRAKKFIKRGFNINAGEYLKIMFQISELDLKNPDVLEEQLIGVDVAYFSTLIDIIRGKYDVDRNFTMTSQYLNVLIDKVFSNHEEETND